MASLEAKVAWPQPSKAASIWPVWLQSSSIACLPRMTSWGCSLATIALSSFATPRGSSARSVSTWRPRSAPMARAVRMVSWQFCGPIETATISLAMPASLRRTASSTAISSNGFIDILTFAVSTPLRSALTRILTLKSITRLTATRIFMEGRPASSCCNAAAIVHAHNAKARASCHRSVMRRRGGGGLTRGAGPPQHVLLAPRIGVTGEDEEMIGKPVEVFDRLGIDRLLQGQRREQALGAAHDCAAEMERRGEGRAARQHEVSQRLQPLFQRVDLAFEPRHLGGADAGYLVQLAARFRQIGAEVEKLVLDARQHRIGGALGVEPRQADCRVGLVHRAVGLDPRARFRDAAAVAEPGLAPIAGAGIDARHRVALSAGRAS